MVLSNAMNNFTGNGKRRNERLKFCRASFVGFQKVGDAGAPIIPASLVTSLPTGWLSFYTGIQSRADGSFLLGNETIG